jgi:hypothetical protein
MRTNLGSRKFTDATVCEDQKKLERKLPAITAQDRGQISSAGRANCQAGRANITNKKVWVTVTDV